MLECRERILIACPHIARYVTGSYPCDANGRYLLRADGTFDVRHARCGQCGGRCTELLCALHRCNRKGAGTWYPTDVLGFRSACEGDRVERPQDNTPWACSSSTFLI
ncbi:MAG: hypothetical protein GVY16_01305 [Planctomycetes bacterium]|nr:hypothetical protein [Phycisphaerae bacterium]NBB94364.1 hypothetical protein [Planctomycetota bacterium]